MPRGFSRGNRDPDERCGRTRLSGRLQRVDGSGHRCRLANDAHLLAGHQLMQFAAIDGPVLARIAREDEDRGRGADPAQLVAPGLAFVVALDLVAVLQAGTGDLVPGLIVVVGIGGVLSSRLLGRSRLFGRILGQSGEG
nr:MAG TPA: hypothetical protein [Inoviridae sp.]